MTDFLTEKETERLLQLEVRQLAMPNGQVRHVNASSLLWQRLDLYVEGHIHSLSEIVGRALDRTTEVSGDFDNALRYVIADLDRRM